MIIALISLRRWTACTALKRTSRLLHIRHRAFNVPTSGFAPAGRTTSGREVAARALSQVITRGYVNGWRQRPWRYSIRGVCLLILPGVGRFESVGRNTPAWDEPGLLMPLRSQRSLWPQPNRASKRQQGNEATRDVAKLGETAPETLSKKQDNTRLQYRGLGGIGAEGRRTQHGGTEADSLSTQGQSCFRTIITSPVDARLAVFERSGALEMGFLCAKMGFLRRVIDG